jgi:hypothetical protein
MCGSIQAGGCQGLVLVLRRCLSVLPCACTRTCEYDVKVMVYATAQCQLASTNASPAGRARGSAQSCGLRGGWYMKPVFGVLVLPMHAASAGGGGGDNKWIPFVDRVYCGGVTRQSAGVHASGPAVGDATHAGGCLCASFHPSSGFDSPPFPSTVHVCC